MKTILQAVFFTLLLGCASHHSAQSSATIGLDEEKDKQIIVSCSGTVVTYTKNDIHLHFVGGGWAAVDVTVIQLNSPKEWAGHQLRVRSQELPVGHPLTRQGLMLKFEISKACLVQEYSGTNGTTHLTHFYTPGPDDLKFLK